MPDVTTAVPEGSGAHASAPEGAVQQYAAQEHAIRSVGAPPGGGGPTPPSGPPSPGGEPPTQGPANPPPQQQEQGRLDMNQVFPPMPELEQQPPWRQMIRTFAAHPHAGPAIWALRDQISGQKGPLD